MVENKDKFYNCKSLFTAKGSDKTQIYALNDKDGNEAIEASEISLVGTILNESNKRVDLNANNFDFL